jgi:Sec-independent protein translocase protein TatA
MRRTFTISILLALLLGTSALASAATAAKKSAHAAKAAVPQKEAVSSASRRRHRAPKAEAAEPKSAAATPPHRARGSKSGPEASPLAAEPHSRQTHAGKGADRRGRVRRASLSRLSTVALGSTAAGSHDSLVRQNVKVGEDGLERIENDTQLHDTIASKALVPVPASEDLTVNPSLPEDRRYCRPWTATFLADLAKAHAEAFHAPVLVSSAVRTVVFQKKLRHHNRNAAPAVGEIASPHLTGAAVDIAKSPLTPQEREWMRNYLLPLQSQGKIDVEEEFREACFHITVYKSYTDPDPVIDLPDAPPAPALTDTADQGK